MVHYISSSVLERLTTASSWSPNHSFIRGQIQLASTQSFPFVVYRHECDAIGRADQRHRRERRPAADVTKTALRLPGDWGSWPAR